MTRVRGLATVWEGCFGSISAVAVTDSMSWCSFRDALSPCIEDYQFHKGGRSIYHIYGPTRDCKDNFVLIADRNYDCTHIYGLSVEGTLASRP